jgi:hypothetical protein
MNEKTDKDTPLEATLLDDGTVLRLRDATTGPEQRRANIVADAQAELEPVVAEAKRIVAEVQKRKDRDQADLYALAALRLDRLVIASGAGRRAQMAGRLDHVLRQLRDTTTEGLAEIPSRVASLTPSQVRDGVPAFLKEEVRRAGSLPDEWDRKLAEVRRLARELAAGPMQEIDTVQIKFPKAQRPTMAVADFNPLD